jgi:hypothetical protein
MQPILASVATAVALAVTAACGRAPADAARAPGAGKAARIVSLSPALTRTVCMLGGKSAVVGRTPWCEAPDAVVVGTLEDRNLEAIAALRPTLVLRQSSVADPALETVAASSGATVHTWHFDRVEDVRAGLDPLARLLAEGGIPGADVAARDLLARHLQAITVPVRSISPVLFLFSVDPPMAFGSGTYVDDLWRAMGGVNAITKAGIPGIFLGLSVLVITGLVCIAVDKLLGGSGIAGAAASSTAGNSTGTPQAVAMADPTFAAIAPIATLQVAASVIVTAVLTPLLTAFVYRRVQKQKQQQQACTADSQTA